MANKHKPKYTKAERGWTWDGYFVRKTKIKKEKIKSLENKHKNKECAY